ncbi:MAG: hypothetical protein WDM81_20605 [Rhizomicrobium sp.]
MFIIQPLVDAGAGASGRGPPDAGRGARRLGLSHHAGHAVLCVFALPTRRMRRASRSADGWSPTSW